LPVNPFASGLLKLVGTNRTYSLTSPHTLWNLCAIFIMFFIIFLFKYLQQTPNKCSHIKFTEEEFYSLYLYYPLKISIYNNEARMQVSDTIRIRYGDTSIYQNIGYNTFKIRILKLNLYFFTRSKRLANDINNKQLNLK
jgi:hypothetical protein